MQTSLVSDPPHEDNACVLDGMAILQTLTTLPEEFGELAIQLLAKVVKIAACFNCKRIDFVPHPRQSIKNIERDRQPIDGVLVIKIYSEHQKVPGQWKKFLSSGENKEQLIPFSRLEEGGSYDVKWHRSLFRASKYMSQILSIKQHVGLYRN